ncbi:MAG: NAD(P)/FAD-dependent oxidoreductase [Bacteroidetes bacterium]|nr:NAD(P)/FAD-dependent oxidoreductase [Bacteroidota bacterium]
MNIQDVVIIGAGPAGIAAAIQLKRYGIEPVVLEKNETGGLLRNANLVENYPGFPRGISGLALIELFRKQLAHARIGVIFENVIQLSYEDGLFNIITNKNERKSRFVVIASGTQPRLLSGTEISGDIVNSIFYEVYPLRHVLNRKIGIIGGGDASFDYAMTLSKCNEVIIVNRNEKTSCLPILWNNAAETASITYLGSTFVKRINPHGDGLLLSLTHGQEDQELYVSYLLIAVGREPCLTFVTGGLLKDYEPLSALKALHLTGDVKNDIYRQTAIATGDGVRAAMEIYMKLTQRKS